MSDTLSIIRPDDWHLHLRDGPALRAVVGDSAKQFARAVVMTASWPRCPGLVSPREHLPR